MNAYRQLPAIDAREIEPLLAASKRHLILLMFSADWCMPCRLFATSLLHIQTANRDTVRCYKIDLEKAGAWAEQWHITSLPTLCWFYDEVLIDRSLGLLPVSHLQTRIDRCLQRTTAP